MNNSDLVAVPQSLVKDNLKQNVKGGPDSGYGKTQSTSKTQSSTTSTDSIESDAESDVTPTSVHQASTPGRNLTESDFQATKKWEYSDSEYIPGCDKLVPKLEEGELALPNTSLTLELKDYYRCVVPGCSPLVPQKNYSYGETYNIHSIYVGLHCTHAHACVYGMHTHTNLYTHTRTCTHTHTHTHTHRHTHTHTHTRTRAPHNPRYIRRCLVFSQCMGEYREENAKHLFE